MVPAPFSERRIDMNLRMTANLVVLPVSWILWEKWIAHNPDSANQQATNSGTPLRHRSGAGDSNDYSTTVYETGKGDKIQGGDNPGRDKMPQEYAFYCLLSSVDP
jgi:hypothetical protein